MYEGKAAQTRYYLIFTRAKYDHWIWRFVDKDIGHVYAVQDLDDYQWLVIQPRLNMTNIEILSKYDFPVIGTIAGRDDKILHVNVDVGPQVRGCVNWFTCVEQIKALIGVKSFWTLTPKQLYCGLIGGKYGTGIKKK